MHMYLKLARFVNQLIYNIIQLGGTTSQPVYTTSKMLKPAKYEVQYEREELE